MGERTTRKITKRIGSKQEEAVEFTLAAPGAISSPAGGHFPAPVDLDEADEQPLAPGKEYSPEFLELALPKLPTLAKQNRARLLMQSPNRIYFYWSVGKNPFHTLNRALGEAAHYTLVLRLLDLTSGEEQIHPAEPSGSWWFSVKPDTEYRAEIGFYAVNRPFIRILYSNTVATPRKSPSPRAAETAEWRVPAEKFARVLDAAGFARDAFDVAIAGDDPGRAEAASRSAFSEFAGRPSEEHRDLDAEEMRFALLALASGASLESLRGQISGRLFAVLAGLAESSGEKALAALEANFEFDAEDLGLEEAADAVFGASLVHFPARLRRGRKIPGLQPVSSAAPRRDR